MPRPLLWGLVALSLCAGLVSLTPPELAPRLINRLWGALPLYTLMVGGGDSCLRCAVGEGGALGPPSLGTLGANVRLDAPIDIVLRPAQPVLGPVFVHAFLRHAGHLGPWPILMEHAADGSLLVSGIARDLLELPPSARGPYELIFVIQRSPLPPSSFAVQAQLTSLRPLATPSPQILRHKLEILSPATP